MLKPSKLRVNDVNTIEYLIYYFGQEKRYYQTVIGTKRDKHSCTSYSSKSIKKRILLKSVLLKDKEPTLTKFIEKNKDKLLVRMEKYNEKNPNPFLKRNYFNYGLKNMKFLFNTNNCEFPTIEKATKFIIKKQEQFQSMGV